MSFAQDSPIYMYWTDPHDCKIQRANLDGSNVVDLVLQVCGYKIAVDVEGGKMYWISSGIYRANLDGSHVEVLFAQDHGLTDIELDVSPSSRAQNLGGGRIYWSDSQPSESTKKIRSANLYGTDIRDHVILTEGSIERIAVDVARGKVYFVRSISGEGVGVWRANLDGTNIEKILSSWVIYDIVLDVLGGKIYYSDRSSIRTSDLDGSNGVQLVSGVDAGDMAIDVARGKMYWAGYGTNVGDIPLAEGILSMNLDGTNTRLLVAAETVEVRKPGHIALGIPQPSVIPPPSGALRFNPNVIPDQTFTVGTPVSLTLPSATGGTAPYTYTLSPIPAGLQFDTTTQLLSGTPITATPATSATYTVTDTAGASASLTFTITVTDATPADITFIPNAIDDLTLTVNTPMDPLYLPLAEGGTPPYIYTLDPIPIGLLFDAGVQLLSGTPTTVGKTAATYTATDTTGASASLTFTIEVIEDGTGPGGDPSDVDGDGQVTVIDLAIVALFYGTQVPVGVSLPADVNADGVVNLADLTAVAQAIDAAGGGANQFSLQEVELALLIAAEQAVALEAAAGAPGRTVASVSVRLSAQNVSDALAATRTDVRFQKGFTVLEKFLALLTEMTTTPETTALLPNYPNPFNPETWIPYHLSKAAEVIVRIYDIRGVSVRALVLGHQAAGVYESRGRAAYWDGRNEIGEPVASGVYFYTITAGDFTATRKLFDSEIIFLI